MNPRQLAALWAGIALSGVLLLFPPQVIAPAMPSSADILKSQIGLAPALQMPVPAIRYALIFAPPAGSVGIDWERFLVPVAVVALLTVGALLTLQSRPALRGAPSGVSP